MAGKKTVIKDKAAEVVDYSRNERNNDPGSNTASQLRNNSKSGPHASGSMRLHRWLLYIEPKSAQEQYYGQLESLDFGNCLITPLFFSNVLSRWTRDALTAVYCAVLLLKGYQMGLLLLPGAREKQAHRRNRFFLILSERVLRQFVATPLLNSGPSVYPWLRQQAAESSRTLFCLRLLLLASGFTISFWNAFCLPLTFTSQLIITTIFVTIQFPASTPNVAFVFQTVLERWPQLLLSQLYWEKLATGALKVLQHPSLLLSAVSYKPAAGNTAGQLHGSTLSCNIPTLPDYRGNSFSAGYCRANWQVQDGDGLTALQQQQPNPCPDVVTLPGRLILALSAAYVIFAVWLLPLYAVWRLERHLKSKWMATARAAKWDDGEALREVQQQLQQQEKETATDAQVLQQCPEDLPPEDHEPQLKVAACVGPRAGVEPAADADSRVGSAHHPGDSCKHVKRWSDVAEAPHGEYDQHSHVGTNKPVKTLFVCNIPHQLASNCAKRLCSSDASSIGSSSNSR